MKHIPDSDLALLAGGEATFILRHWASRHLRVCPSCQGRAQEFVEIRQKLSRASTELDLPAVQWNALAAEMRANIRLGLEAGACVRSVPETKRLNPRLVVAFASLFLLLGTGVYFNSNPVRRQSPDTTTSVLAATSGGLELRTGANSLTLLNHHGAVADQTVGSEGEIRARYVDNETGSVTINNVYLQD